MVCGIKDDGFAPGVVGANFGFAGELVDMHVAGSDHAPCGRDADDRLGEILRLKTDRVEHRATGRPFGSIENLGGKGAS